MDEQVSIADELAELFWGAVPQGEYERTPKRIVEHALASIKAFENGKVVDPVTQKPMELMSLIADQALKENLLYASPEMARGETFDQRAVVFAVGVLVFERLTDRHPFGTSQTVRVARIRKGEMGSGVNYFPSVPKDLRTILVRAMGPFPEERYSSIAQLKAELSRFIERTADEPAVPAKPPMSDPKSPTSVSSKPTTENVVVSQSLADAPADMFTAADRAAEAKSDVALEDMPTNVRGLNLEATRKSMAPDIAPEDQTGQTLGAPDEPATEEPEMDETQEVSPLPRPSTRVKKGSASLAKQRLQGALAGVTDGKDLSALQPKRSVFAKYAPIWYLLMGAVGATVVFLVIGRKPAPPPKMPEPTVSAKTAANTAPAKNAPAKPAPQKAPPSKPAPKVAAGSVDAAATSAADAAPDTTPPTKVATGTPKSAPPAVPTGEPKPIQAGRLVLAKVAGCRVTFSRPLRVAVFTRKNGKIVRAFVSKGPKSSQVRCIRKATRNMQLPITLRKADYIEWRFSSRDGAPSIKLLRPHAWRKR